MKSNIFLITASLLISTSFAEAVKLIDINKHEKFEGGIEEDIQSELTAVTENITKIQWEEIKKDEDAFILQRKLDETTSKLGYLVPFDLFTEAYYKKEIVTVEGMIKYYRSNIERYIEEKMNKNGKKEELTFFNNIPKLFELEFSSEEFKEVQEKVKKETEIKKEIKRETEELNKKKSYSKFQKEKIIQLYLDLISQLVESKDNVIKNEKFVPEKDAITVIGKITSLSDNVNCIVGTDYKKKNGERKITQKIKARKFYGIDPQNIDFSDNNGKSSYVKMNYYGPLLFVESQEGDLYPFFDPYDSEIAHRNSKKELMELVDVSFIEDLKGKNLPFKTTGKYLQKDGIKYPFVIVDSKNEKVETALVKSERQFWSILANADWDRNMFHSMMNNNFEAIPENLLKAHIDYIYDGLGVTNLGLSKNYDIFDEETFKELEKRYFKLKSSYGNLDSGEKISKQNLLALERIYEAAKTRLTYETAKSKSILHVEKRYDEALKKSKFETELAFNAYLNSYYSNDHDKYNEIKKEQLFYLYKILEVEKEYQNTFNEEIDTKVKQKYKKLSKKYHPDLNKNTDADSEFKAFSRAYETWEIRSKYEQALGKQSGKEEEKRGKEEENSENWKRDVDRYNRDTEFENDRKRSGRSMFYKDLSS